MKATHLLPIAFACISLDLAVARSQGAELDNNRIVNASFNGAPIGGTFTSHGTRLGNNYALLGKGLQVQLTDQWSLFGSYDLMVGSGIHAHTGSLGSVYVW